MVGNPSGRCATAHQVTMWVSGCSSVFFLWCAVLFQWFMQWVFSLFFIGRSGPGVGTSTEQFGVDAHHGEQAAFDFHPVRRLLLPYSSSSLQERVWFRRPLLPSCGRSGKRFLVFTSTHILIGSTSFSCLLFSICFIFTIQWVSPRVPNFSPAGVRV